MAKTLLATAVCRGINGRVSGNFSTNNYPAGTKSFIWEVKQDGAANTNIVFSIKDDVRMAPDPYYLRNIKHGKRTAIFADRGVFVADPDGSGNKDFSIEVYASDEPVS